MELYVLPCPHFFCGLVFPTLLLTSQFQTNLLASVSLFLWFQKIFLHLFSFPHRTSSPIYFCQGHFRHDDLLGETCKTLLFSAHLLVQQSFLEPLSLQKEPKHHPVFRFLLSRYAASNSVFYLLKSYSSHAENAQSQ